MDFRLWDAWSDLGVSDFHASEAGTTEQTSAKSTTFVEVSLLTAACIGAAVPHAPVSRSSARPEHGELLKLVRRPLVRAGKTVLRWLQAMQRIQTQRMRDAINKRLIPSQSCLLLLK
jgi:hypothetical protein